LVAFAGCSKKQVIDKVMDGPVFAAPAPVVEAAPEPKKAPEPEAIELPRVQFAFDSYALNDESLHTLWKIAREMQKDKSLNIMIYGATCPIGTESYNLALGEHRALACQKYLVNAGIDPMRIAALSWGQSEQHMISFEPSKYWVNRRAEFTWEFTKGGAR
jgi:peptidoglycan-associated lipoprotein